MNELEINLSDCMLGNVLSRDVISQSGLKIAEKDTIINKKRKVNYCLKIF